MRVEIAIVCLGLAALVSGKPTHQKATFEQNEFNQLKDLFGNARSGLSNRDWESFYRWLMTLSSSDLTGSSGNGMDTSGGGRNENSWGSGSGGDIGSPRGSWSYNYGSVQSGSIDSFFPWWWFKKNIVQNKEFKGNSDIGDLLKLLAQRQDRVL